MRPFQTVRFFLVAASAAALAGSGCGGSAKALSRDAGGPSPNTPASTDTVSGDSGGLPDSAGSTDGTGGGAGSATVLEFCNGVFQAMSSAIARCWGGTDAYWVGVYSAVFDCQRVSADVAAGRMVYDQSHAAACLSSIEGVDCSVTTSSDPGGLPACTQVLWGTVPAGQACSPDPMSNCVPEASCEQVGYACGGTCRTRVTVNGSCQSVDGTMTLPCVAGAHCVSGVCLADAQEGQSCDGYAGPTCASNLRCLGATSSASGTCQAIETSQPCTDISDCGGGVYGCMGPTGAKTCARWKFTGDSCTPGQGDCWRWFHCGADGRCVDAPATQSQACGFDASGEFVGCASGLYCNGLTSTAMGTCVPVKALGDSCTSLVECGYPHGLCDTSTQRCVACN